MRRKWGEVVGRGPQEWLESQRNGEWSKSCCSTRDKQDKWKIPVSCMLYYAYCYCCRNLVNVTCKCNSKRFPYVKSFNLMTKL